MIKFATGMTVYATLALLGLAVASGEAPAPDSPKSQNVLDEIRQHGDGLAIWWTGHNGWLINELEPDYILPQHRDTYPVTQRSRFWTYAYTYDVQRRLSKGLQSRYHIVDMGRRFDIAP